MSKPRLVISGLLIIAVMSMFTAFPGIGMAQQQNSGNKSMMRVIHASPGSPPVDVYVDGRMVLRNQKYRHASNYLELSPGSHHVRMVTTGKGFKGTPLINRTVSVRPNENYSFMAVGDTKNMHLLPMASNQRVARGTCRIRFVHASSDTPPVDVAIRGGRFLSRHVSFGNSSGYVEIKPTAANLEIRQAGTQKVLLNVPSVNLKSDNLYSLNLLGHSKGKPGLEATLTVDANMQPSSMPRTGMGGASMK